MPFPAMPDKEVKRRLGVWRKCGRNISAAGRVLGIGHSNVAHVLDLAMRRKLLTAKERHQTAENCNTPLALRRDETIPALQREVAMLIKERDAALATLERSRKAKPSKHVTLSPARTDDFVRVVIPDSHGAHIDPEAVGAFLADLKALNPHEIVMLGDHVDAGGFLAQHHVLGYVPETTYTYEDDIKSAACFLDQIQHCAPRARIHYIEGNHESRVEKWCIAQTLRNRADSDFLRRSFAPEFVLNLKARGITYYRRAIRYDGLPIPGCIKLGKTFFCHEPGRGGRPEQYAQRFGGCLYYGHEHRARGVVVRTVAAGEIGAWCPGTLAIQQPYYFHTNLTDHSHGFGVQLVAKSGGFLAVQVPIIGGVSHLRPLIAKGHV